VPLTPKQAVDAASQILNGPRIFEASRIEMIRNALRNRQPTVEVPDKAPPVMKRLAAKARTNYLPLVLQAYTESLRVDGYRSGGSPAADAPPWQTWMANGLSSRQVGVHRSALAYGAAYVIVLPGEIADPMAGQSRSRAVLRGASARSCTAVYQDPVNDDYPVLALHVNGPRLRLYDETSEYHIGVEKLLPRPGLAPDWYQTAPYGFSFLERRDHNLGVCPVVRFRDSKLLDDEDEFGIIEPLLPIQQRLDETVFGLLVAQFFGAFKQRYILGWIPESEYEQLAASASQLWTFKDGPQDVQVGELSETDLTRYLAAKEAAIRDIASLAQLPAQSLGLDGIHNISAEALAGLEAAKDRRSDAMAESLGESWKQTLQLAAWAEGDEASARDESATVHWQDTTARSMAQTVDALGKLAATLDVPKRALWSLIPNVTQTDVEAWSRIADESNPMLELQRQLETAATPTPTPPVTPTPQVPSVV
jgi:Phage portal protein, SPP1 Gp6-like